MMRGWVCGPAGWTTLPGSESKGAGQAANILIAYIGMSARLAGPEGYIGYAIYTIAKHLFSVFCDLFGPAQFKGSLQPRPSVPNQADILNTFGVPISGANSDRQLHQKPPPEVLSPGMSFLQNTSF